MSTYVFVHGGWHGAWCWYRVVSLLEKHGHVAHAIDLPGHGRDRTPLAAVTIQGYVDAVLAQLDALPEPVNLVAHSSGGVLVSQVAEIRPEKIRTLVYLAAFLPRDGESIMSLFQQATTSTLLRSIVPSPDGSVLRVPDHAQTESFYGTSPEEDRVLARLSLVPQAMAPGLAPVRTTSERFGRVPRVYIHTLRDQTIPIEDQRRMVAAQPCRDVFTLDTDHAPFFSAPAELVTMLEGV